jgi:outer membrane protein
MTRPRSRTRREGRSLRWLGLASAAAVLAAFSFSSAARAETLSADQAVAKAAAQSPTLRAALLDAVAAEHAVAAEKGAREPTLSASVSGEYAESISSQGGSSARSDSKSVSSNVALRYTTDIGTSLEAGVSAGANWRGQRTTTSTGSAPINLNPLGPSYSAQAYASARQPLLRGAGTDAVLAPYVQAQAAAKSADLSRDATASQMALDVLSAYWELWYAEQAVAVQEAALAAAQRLVADAKARAETLGTGSKVDVLQFSTSAASIADSLSQARATRASRAIELGRVLGMDPAASTSLKATGAPPAAGDVPPEDFVERAVMERSIELASLRADLDATRSRVAVAEDSGQVRVDLFTTVSAGMLWADDDLPGISLPGGRPAFGVLGGVELELPVGGGRLSADVSRARAQLSAAQARYQARVDSIKAQASSLRVSLEASQQQVELASETARIARELAEAEKQRLLLGTTTSADVVRAEQTAREAELRKLRASVSQATSQLSLEHATGELLEKFASVLSRRSS